MKAALPLVLVLPFAAAHADLIGVEYEGTVTEIGEGPINGGGVTFEHAVGDRIAGLLLIDTSRGYHQTAYGPNYFQSFYPDFVSGIFSTTAEESGDELGYAHRVTVSGIDGPVDTFFVQDGYIQANTDVRFSLDALLHDDFLHGTDLRSFELTSADVNEPDEHLSGFISDVNQGWNNIKFTLSRLTVKPGRCLAPS